MRGGSHRCPFPPLNAFHGRRNWCFRALSFLLKGCPWHAGAGAQPSLCAPAFPPVPLGPAPARRRPCEAPVGPLIVHALAVPRSGLVVSKQVPGCRPRCRPRRRRPGTRWVPLHLAGAGPLPPGSIPAPRRPLGLPACRPGPGWSPLLPQPGALPTPLRSRRWRCPDVPSAVRPTPCRFPPYGCMRGEPPRHQQLFLKFFSRIFPAPPFLAFPQVDAFGKPMAPQTWHNGRDRGHPVNALNRGNRR